MTRPLTPSSALCSATLMGHRSKFALFGIALEMIIGHWETTSNSLVPILTPLRNIGMSPGQLEDTVPKSAFWLEIALCEGSRKASNHEFASHFELATGPKPFYLSPSCDIPLCLESPLVSIAVVKMDIIEYLLPIKVALHSGDGVRFVPPKKYSSSDAGRFH